MVKNLPVKTGALRDTNSIPGSGKSSRGGNGNPLQHSYLENPMDRGTWWATVHGVTESDMTEQLTLIYSLSPENSPLEWVVLFYPFYRC